MQPCTSHIQIVMRSLFSCQDLACGYHRKRVLENMLDEKTMRVIFMYPNHLTCFVLIYFCVECPLLCAKMQYSYKMTENRRQS